MFNIIRALCVLFLFASLAACAANGNSERAKDAPILVGIAGAMLLALDERKGNNDGGSNSAATPTPPPQMTMTTAAPMPLDFNAPEIGAAYYRNGNEFFIIVFSVDAQMPDKVIYGNTVTLQRRTVISFSDPGFVRSPTLNRASLHAHGDIVPLVEGGNTVFVESDSVAPAEIAAFQTRPSISVVAQLCPVPWLVAFLNDRFDSANCPVMSGMSYSPQMGRVVVAAMSDGFRRGVIVGESAFSFSGRYDGENRAAGFAYDFGNFQMRTDYIRLPSKQDSEVWLDTYRLGVLRPINDETRIFAGMDSYDNAIFAIDINTKSDTWHRLGAAMAKSNKEYAIKYELRLNL